MTHTPTPWAVTKSSSYNTDIRAVEGQRVACTFVGSPPKRNRGESLANWQGRYHAQALRNEANARHIVHCVNTHDALVKALEGCIPSGVCLTNSNIPDDTIVPIDATMGELRAVAAALALAKGEGE